MPRAQHILERRSALLASRMRQNSDNLVNALRMADDRIPFKTKLSKDAALQWWAQHRYDSIGQTALQGLDPLSISSLDAALAEHVQSQSEDGMPVEQSPSGLPAEDGAKVRHDTD